MLKTDVEGHQIILINCLTIVITPTLALTICVISHNIQEVEF